MSTRMKLITFLFIVSVLLLAFTTETFSILLSGDIDGLRALANNNMYLLLLLTLLLMTIQNMFPIIPFFLLISVNITMFGIVPGYLWSWFISIIAAIVSFMMSRFWFQSFFIPYVREDYKRKIEEKGFWFVFIGRIVPIMPTSIINSAAGISSVRFNKFLYATILGNMIYILVLSLISHGIFSLV